MRFLVGTDERHCFDFSDHEDTEVGLPLMEPVDGEFLTKLAGFARFLLDRNSSLQKYERYRLSQGRSNNIVTRAATAPI